MYIFSYNYNSLLLAERLYRELCCVNATLLAKIRSAHAPSIFKIDSSRKECAARKNFPQHLRIVESCRLCLYIPAEPLSRHFVAVSGRSCLRNIAVDGGFRWQFPSLARSYIFSWHVPSSSGPTCDSGRNRFFFVHNPAFWGHGVRKERKNRDALSGRKSWADLAYKLNCSFICDVFL